LALAATLVAPPLANASELGRALTRNFTHRDFAAPGQIFATVQASDGRVYLASQQAVLEYDGSAWIHHTIPSSFIHSIGIDSSDRVFVGAHDEIGFFERRDSGQMEYRSLTADVPAELKPFGFPRGVAVRDDGVFFGLARHVLRWRDNRFEVWTFPEAAPPLRLRALGDELFLHRPGDALYRFDGDEFQPFVRDPAIRDANQFALWRLPDGALLIGAGASGLWIWRNDTLSPWANSAAELLQRTTIGSGVSLPDGRIAIGTLDQGIVLVAADGQHHQHYTIAQGIIDPAVRDVSLDRDGALWVGTDGGITWFDPSDGATIFDASNGLRQPIINGIWRHADRLYVSTLDGLLRLMPGDSALGTSARFEKVPSIGRNAREMASDRDGLLIGTPDGLVRLDAQDRAELVLPLGQLALHPRWSEHSPDTLLLGYGDGLLIARRTPSGFEELARFDGLAEVRTLAESADGTIWLGTPTRGFHRVTRAPGEAGWSHASVTTYHQSNGRLQEGHGWVEVFPSPFGVLYSSGNGWLRYRPESDDFTSEDRFSIDGKSGTFMRPVQAAANGDLWLQATNHPMHTEHPLGRFRRGSDGKFAWTDAPKKLWDVIGISGAQVLYWEPGLGEGILWVKGIDSLLRLELDKLNPRRADWQVVLKTFRQHGDPQPVTNGTTLPRLPWSSEPIRISYASPRFDYGAGIRYQTRLRGFSDEWSELSARDEATFTNLSGGPFTFAVRAVDAEGNVSKPAHLTFSVAPPWHRNNVALACYALVGLGAVGGLVRWRLSRAIREHARLEALVARRTVELDAANKAKSAFLANMSHELRTPLNGVIGYAQVLQKSANIVAQDRERLRIVQTSGEHLLRMINEVLDFSKIEAGKLELRPAPFNLPQLLRDLFTALEARAIQKQLHFSLELAADLPATVVGDAQKLRQILDNLLGNAVKFTSRGAVVLRAFPTDGHIAFAVEDTGSGIPEKEQANLFQPFHQPADGRPPEPGTGLGLAIARRLVALMGGELTFETTPGRGSTFSFAVTLEALASGSHDAEPVARPPIGYRGPRRRLLVVDDVAINRSVLVELLQPLGFELREAASGTEALALMPTFQPQLVFLDLRMPGMDGLELTRRLRALPVSGEPLVLVAMSASVLSFNRDSALEAGCDDFLPKPFREADLIAKLSMHLRIEWRHGLTAHPFSGDKCSAPASTVELGALLETARRGEIRALREQLAALRETHPSDPRLLELETLARDYQMERIRAQLAEFLAGAKPTS
jgi:signal transduction histidine kinase/DNA-binding response OmpR family regulator